MGNLAIFSEGSGTGFCELSLWLSRAVCPPLVCPHQSSAQLVHGQYNQNKPPVKSKEHVCSSGIRAVFINL